jgi:hypothetical protein
MADNRTRDFRFKSTDPTTNSPSSTETPLPKQVVYLAGACGDEGVLRGGGVVHRGDGELVLAQQNDHTCRAVTDGVKPQSKST